MPLFPGLNFQIDLLKHRLAWNVGKALHSQRSLFLDFPRRLGFAGSLPLHLHPAVRKSGQLLACCQVPKALVSELTGCEIMPM